MARQSIKNSATDASAEPTDLRSRGQEAIEQLRGQASTQIESMPLFALAGGLALGALIASILPQSERETALLEPVGSKVTDAGRASIDKVREAGKAKVDELAGDRLREFFGFGGSSGTAG